MKITFTAQRFTLASVNARSEVHGESREPAGDLGLTTNLPNDVLSIFDPNLKSLLYHFDASRPRDLADQGKSAEAGYLPDLRFPRMATPIKWDDEIAGVRVTIRRSGERDAIVLDPVKVNKFAFTPQDGGTVVFDMRVQAHPDERAFGRLAVLVQQEVEVTLEESPTPEGDAAPSS